MLPASFCSPQDLPFNRACLRKNFLPSSPDADPGGRGVYVLLRGTELLVRPGVVPSLPRQAPPEISASAVYIGAWNGEPCRAVSLPDHFPLPENLLSENLLAPDPRLPIELLSLGGAAGQILHWEKTSAFCPRCGGGNGRLAGGWGKKCQVCGYDHFPHIHPCVIVLVRRPGEVLLTRKALWPGGRYSLVAGFLDFGECLEEAVIREVREETGVRVHNVRYIGSQSWPFPSQLMAGFTADYAGGEVVVEEAELEDARWFPVDNLPSLPPRRSIARYILDHFLQP
ncbi:MAG: NAD(+) diphosphatase [Desulfuromonadales bacterium]